MLIPNSQGKRDFEKEHKVKSRLLPEIGLHAVANELPRKEKDTGTLRILFNSKWEHRKARSLLIHALTTGEPVYMNDPTQRHLHPTAKAVALGH